MKRLLFVCLLGIGSLDAHKPTLTIAGLLDFNVGLGKISYGLIDMLSDVYDVSYYPTSVYSLEADPYGIEGRFKLIDNCSQKTDFFMYIESIQVLEEDDSYMYVPKGVKKYAYSMFEATRISLKAVERLNTYFDEVIVPDEFLIEVYQKSGVIIPVRCIPTGLYLDRFLELPLKEVCWSPFTFGCVATRYERKNLKKLIDSFFAQFGNDKNVHLKIHAADYFQDGVLEKYIKSLGTHTITISAEPLNEDQYVEFLYTLDCYVLLSKGEGFSNTPREAMAAGIPIIITNNTGHKTILKSGCGIGIDCFEVPADYQGFVTQEVGNQYDCTNNDVQKALAEMMNHYAFYQNQLIEARKWVMQYCWQNLKGEFIQLLQ